MIPTGYKFPADVLGVMDLNSRTGKEIIYWPYPFLFCEEITDQHVGFIFVRDNLSSLKKHLSSKMLKNDSQKIVVPQSFIPEVTIFPDLYSFSISDERSKPDKEYKIETIRDILNHKDLTKYFVTESSSLELGLNPLLLLCIMKLAYHDSDFRACNVLEERLITPFQMIKIFPLCDKATVFDGIAKIVR